MMKEDMTQNSPEADWAYLPHVVLSQIFQNLSSLDRLTASYVCQSWFTASTSRDTWRSFDFSADSIDDCKLDIAELMNGPVLINNVSGNVEQLEDPRVLIIQMIYLDIIKKFGKYFQNLSLKSDGLTTCILYDSLYLVCDRLKSISLQNVSNRFQEIFCALLQKNRNLVNIRLVNLKFDSKNEPLPIGHHHALTLKKLYLVNSFKTYNLGTLMYLVSLKELSMEPQLLSYSLLHHLASYSLTDLYILALSKITGFYQEAMQDWHWREICKQGPKFRVHFRFSSSHEWTEKEIILKPSIPVKSMIYYKYRLVHFIPLRPLVVQYSSTLEVFIDYSIAMASYDAARSDKDIAGMNCCLLDIVRYCQNLRTFAVKEVLSSSTLLAMVAVNKNLKELYVMEEQIIYENFTDSYKELPDGISELLNENCTEETFVPKMTDLLGKPWRPLRSEDYFQTVKSLCSHFINN